jgi:hypothetical protein
MINLPNGFIIMGTGSDCEVNRGLVQSITMIITEEGVQFFVGREVLKIAWKSIKLKGGLFVKSNYEHPYKKKINCFV